MQTVNHHSCGTVVYTQVNGKVEYLLLKYPQGHWDFAKGHIEENESIVACALRELTEETGINKVQLIDGFFHELSYYYRQDAVAHYKKVDFFLVEAFETQVKISHEHRDFKWLPFQEALELVSFENAKNLLIAADSFLKTLHGPA
ncbi:NUDIX domain-containing protein [bacterium]|jgi:bis(5'-nucleosidyl)-tetraphosphatase|nr:NUDIX domain-containing protein [bacterium]